MRVQDNLGRKINYLRLSVTDRCNMRCVYCMPAAGIDKLAHTDILSYEQLLLLAEAAVSLGIEKIRVTGGEPLIRAGILDFLSRLAAIAGLKHLVLTTNGIGLSAMAPALKDAGVQRLNISLDTLRPEVFKQLTRRNLLPEVLAGIEAADRAGLPYKINMVVMRGRNDSEILDFAGLALHQGCTVRFIEYMPALKEENWQSLVVPGEEILQLLADNFELDPTDRGPMAGPAYEFALARAQGRGRIGIIAPFSGHFCRDCNRIRITAAGKVRSCLFSNQEFDLKPLLESPDIVLIADRLRQLIDAKPACHTLTAGASGHSAFSMAKIGG